jgi:hypothetical protein
MHDSKHIDEIHSPAVFGADELSSKTQSGATNNVQINAAELRPGMNKYRVLNRGTDLKIKVQKFLVLPSKRGVPHLSRVTYTRHYYSYTCMNDESIGNLTRICIRHHINPQCVRERTSIRFIFCFK